jgi:hypothetical protein
LLLLLFGSFCVNAESSSDWGVVVLVDKPSADALADTRTALGNAAGDFATRRAVPPTRKLDTS